MMRILYFLFIPPLSHHSPFQFVNKNVADMVWDITPQPTSIIRGDRHPALAKNKIRKAAMVSVFGFPFY